MKNLLKYIAPKKTTSAFWICFLVCLFGCFCIIYIVSPITGLSKNFGAGNDGYIELARNLRSGNGYVFEKDGPEVFNRPPLYPAVLVPIAYLPENMQRIGLIILQSFMVGLIGALVFSIAEKLFSIFTAQLAILLLLINPWLYWHAKNPMTVIFQTLLYLLFVFLIYGELLFIFGKPEKTKYTNTLLKWIAIGITAGALSLVHGTMIAVCGLILVLLALVSLLRKKAKTLVLIFISILTMACVISPWTYRNWIVFNRFIPVAGGGGLAYFNGNVHWSCTSDKPQQKGEGYIDASLRVTGIGGTEQTMTHWKGFKDIELEEKINKAMVEDIRSHPGRFMVKAVLNAIEYYFPMFTYPFLAVKTISVENIAITIWYLVLWLPAITGICFRKESKEIRFNQLLLLAGIFLYAMWFFPFATHIGHSLYSFGTVTLLSILAAEALKKLLMRANLS